MRATELFAIFTLLKSLERISICPGFTPSFMCSGVVSVPTSLIPSALLNILSPFYFGNQTTVYTADTTAPIAPVIDAPTCKFYISQIARPRFSPVQVIPPRPQPICPNRHFDLTALLPAPVLNRPTCKFYISQIARPRFSPVQVIPPRPQPICRNRHLNPTFEVPGPKSPWIIAPPFLAPSKSSLPRSLSPLPSEKLRNNSGSLWLPLAFTLVLVLSIWNFYRVHVRRSRRCTAVSRVANDRVCVSSWSQPSVVALERRKPELRERVGQSRVYISALPSLPALATLQGGNVTSETQQLCIIDTPGLVYSPSSIPPPRTTTESLAELSVPVAPSLDEESAVSSPVVSPSPPPMLVPAPSTPPPRTATVSPVELPVPVAPSTANEDSLLSSPVVPPTPPPMPLPLPILAPQPVRPYISLLLSNDISLSPPPSQSPVCTPLASPICRSFEKSVALESESRVPTPTPASLSKPAPSLPLNEEKRSLASSCWIPTPALAPAPAPQSEPSLPAAPSMPLDTQRGLCSSRWVPNTSASSPPPLVRRKRVRTQTSEVRRANPILLPPRARTPEMPKSTAPLPALFRTPSKLSASSLSQSIWAPKSDEESVELENTPVLTSTPPPSGLADSIWATMPSSPPASLPTPPPSTKKAPAPASLFESIWAPKPAEDVVASPVTPPPVEKVLGLQDLISATTADVPEVVLPAPVPTSLASPPPSVKKAQGKEFSLSPPAIVETPFQASSSLSQSIWAPKPAGTSAEDLEVVDSPPVEKKVSGLHDSIWATTPSSPEAIQCIPAPGSLPSPPPSVKKTWDRTLDTPLSPTIETPSRPVTSPSESIWAPTPLEMTVKDEVAPIVTPPFIEKNETSGLQDSIWATPDIQETLDAPASVSLSTPPSSEKEALDEGSITPSLLTIETPPILSASIPQDSIWVTTPDVLAVDDTLPPSPSSPSSSMEISDQELTTPMTPAIESSKPLPSLSQSIWVPDRTEVIVEDAVPTVTPSAVEVSGLQDSIWATTLYDAGDVEPITASAMLPTPPPNEEETSDCGIDSPLSLTVEAPSQASASLSQSIWAPEPMEAIVEDAIVPAVTFPSTENSEFARLQDSIRAATPDVPEAVVPTLAPPTVTPPPVEKVSRLQDSIWTTTPNIPEVIEPTLPPASLPTPQSIKKAPMKGSSSPLPTTAETSSEPLVSLSESIWAPQPTEVNVENFLALDSTHSSIEKASGLQDSIWATTPEVSKEVLPTLVSETSPMPVSNVEKLPEEEPVMPLSPIIETPSKPVPLQTEKIIADEPAKMETSTTPVLPSTPTPVASQEMVETEHTISDLLLACEQQCNTVSSSRWALIQDESTSTPSSRRQALELSAPLGIEEIALDLEALLTSCETRKNSVGASRWAPGPIAAVTAPTTSFSNEATSGSSTPPPEEKVSEIKAPISPMPSTPVPALVEKETFLEPLDLLLLGTPPPCDEKVPGLSGSIWASPVSPAPERAPMSSSPVSGLGVSIWATAPSAPSTPAPGSSQKDMTSEPLKLLLPCERRNETVSASRWATAPDITEPGPSAGRKPSKGSAAGRQGHRAGGGKKGRSGNARA
ncbi:hypothetical protein C0995_012836 [Termitomyces sp. Mi166|nr:hypothetical protein C0995_012836 [Termitomyces sp. Mi166\